MRNEVNHIPTGKWNFGTNETVIIGGHVNSDITANTHTFKIFDSSGNLKATATGTLNYINPNTFFSFKFPISSTSLLLGDYIAEWEMTTAGEPETIVWGTIKFTKSNS
jgi:hypothetical protein